MVGNKRAFAAPIFAPAALKLYSAEQGLLLLQQANLNNQIELYKTLGGGLKANTSDTVVNQPSSAELKKQ